MAQVDPKVYFANERTFLKWLHTSVTLGSVATGLLGVSSSIGQGSTGSAIITYHKRAKLLDMRRSDGFDENVAPMGMAGALVVALGAIYVVSLFKKGPVPHV